MVKYASIYNLFKLLEIKMDPELIQKVVERAYFDAKKAHETGEPLGKRDENASQNSTKSQNELLSMLAFASF